MELLGFPVSIDPLTFLGTDDRAGRIDWSSYVPVSHLSEYAGRQVTVCGLTVTDRVNPTQAGELMKFVTLADHTGVVEALLLPDVYRRFGHLTAAHPILAVTGRVEPFENRNGLTLRACHLAPPHRCSSPQT
jgi:DNA polymerase III alpha subunit